MTQANPVRPAAGATAVPSYSGGTSTMSLLGDTIGANLDRTVDRVGEHEALVECATGRRFSYRQLVDEVDACALGLAGLGVAKGDRVGIWAPNCAEWVFVQFGTAKLGAIMVNINPAYRSHELAYVMRQAGVSVLISAPEFKTSDYRAMVAQVRGDCPELREVIFLGDPAWEKLMGAGGAADHGLLTQRVRELSADDPINIQYTSGTTGFPKGATLTHHNLLNNGFFVGEGCGYTEADRVCIPVPYYHCFGRIRV
jgi:fatty-acyl-CoA synthase